LFEQQKTGRAFVKVWHNINITNAKNFKAKRESLGARTSSRLNIQIKLKSTQKRVQEKKNQRFCSSEKKNAREEFKAAAQKDTAKRCTRLTGNP